METLIGALIMVVGVAGFYGLLFLAAMRFRERTRKWTSRWQASIASRVALYVAVFAFCSLGLVFLAWATTDTFPARAPATITHTPPAPTVTIP